MNSAWHMASKQLNLGQFLTIRYSSKPSRTTVSKENRIQKVIVAETIS